MVKCMNLLFLHLIFMLLVLLNWSILMSGVQLQLLLLMIFVYYVLFVDVYSKFTWLYLLKHKSDVLDVFKYFKATVENQLNSKIKILRTNNGGEFTFNAFKLFCSSHGIIHQFSCPHTPQQNGVAERKHRHVVEYGLTMLSHSKLP